MGNKSDMEKTVNRHDLELAKRSCGDSFKIEFVTCSAKNGEAINDIFSKMLELILSVQEAEEDDQSKSITFHR